MQRTHRNAGFGLVELMLSATILGLMGAAFSQMLGNSFRSARALDSNLDVLQVWKNIIDSASCAATLSSATNPGFSPALCSSTQEQVITLVSYGKPTRTLVGGTNATATRSGMWTLKATCSQSGIRVYAALPKPTNPQPLTSVSQSEKDFNKAPGTGIVVHWGDSRRRSLTKDVPICANEVAALLNPQSTGGGQISTPQGQCVVLQKVGFRNSMPTAPDGAWRGINLNCPSDYPVAMSASILNSCFSNGWNAMTNYVVGSYPTAVTCSNLFYEDYALATGGINQTFLSNMQQKCQAWGTPIDQIRCQAVCCKL